MAHNIQSQHNNRCQNTFRFDFETEGFKTLQNQRDTRRDFNLGAEKMQRYTIVAVAAIVAFTAKFFD